MKFKFTKISVILFTYRRVELNKYYISYMHFLCLKCIFISIFFFSIHQVDETLKSIVQEVTTSEEFEKERLVFQVKNVKFCLQIKKFVLDVLVENTAYPVSTSQGAKQY